MTSEHKDLLKGLMPYLTALLAVLAIGTYLWKVTAPLVRMVDDVTEIKETVGNLETAVRELENSFALARFRLDLAEERLEHHP